MIPISDQPPLLEMRGIDKRFPGVHALKQVNLDLYGGEVLAVMGENGAGKSTLIKTLGGVRADSGTILIDGQEVQIDSPMSSVAAGIAIIYQEFNLIPGLRVRENIFLGRELSRATIINRRAERQRVAELFNRLGVRIDPEALCRDLSIAEQQSVEIAKALSLNARIIVMDEPTATLTPQEVNSLLAIVRDLRNQGIGIVYISHRLEEIGQIADRVMVLRDGEQIATRRVRAGNKCPVPFVQSTRRASSSQKVPDTYLPLITNQLGNNIADFNFLLEDAAMKSAAVVNFAPEKESVELREIEKPSIGPDDVLLEVANVGVCGSDLHQWTADHSWPVNYPVVLGHEFGGRIVELGAAVEGWSEGDRVVSETAAIIDQRNPMSRRGLYNLDPTRKGFGYGVNGAMTKYVRVPSRILHAIPDSLPFEHACLTEPCCVAYNAVVKNARIEPGDRVVVLGPGTIGILCAAMAKLCGAEVALVGLESDRHRLEIAKQYGCEAIIGDAKPWVLKRDGLGCDGVIDAAGASITLKIALDLVRPAGWISKVGWGPQPLGFNIDQLVQKNVTLQGSFSHNWPIWERVIAMLASGQLNVQPIIGGVWPITDWHTAFEKMHKGEVVKSVLRPV